MRFACGDGPRFQIPSVTPLRISSSQSPRRWNEGSRRLKTRDGQVGDGRGRMTHGRGGRPTLKGTSMTLRGSCLCGAVQYELTQEPVWSHHCHCSRCRKTSGSAFASNLFFKIEALRYSRGRNYVRSFKPADAERFTHVFCGRCGSTLPFLNQARGLAGVPTGSLDDDPRYEPRAHIFVDSKAPWFKIMDPLPQYPGMVGASPPPGDPKKGLRRDEFPDSFRRTSMEAAARTYASRARGTGRACSRGRRRVAADGHLVARR